MTETFVPTPGTRVEIKRTERRHYELEGSWTSFIVQSVAGEYASLTPKPPGEFIDLVLRVHLNHVEQPLGWQAVYEPVCSPENHTKMLGWLRDRAGLAVFVGIDMCRSNLGAHSFGPGDRPTPPVYHFRLVEVVTDPARLEFYYSSAMTLPSRRDERERVATHLNAARIRHKVGRVSPREWVADIAFADLEAFKTLARKHWPNVRVG